VSNYSSQPSTIAPGKEGGGPAPAQPSQGAPSGPPADGGGGSIFGSLPMMLMFLLPLLFVFLMTRNQTKKQRDMESGLKAGDRVFTQAGLLGKIIDIGERKVKLEIAPGVNVEVLKGSIQGIEGDAKAAAEAKDKAQEKKA
jgi:preprotein translocase subunit YajC